MSPQTLRAGARLGFLAVALSAILFSAKAVFIKMSLARGASPESFMALRTLFCLPFFGVMAGMAWWKDRGTARRISGRDLAGIAGLGLVGYYLSSLFNVHGLQWVSAGMERMILFVYPTLVVIFGAILHRKPLERDLILPLALSYAGVALAYGHEALGAQAGSRPHFGAFLIFLSAVLYAVFLAFQTDFIARLGPHRVTSFAMLFGSAAVLLHFVLRNPLGDLRQDAVVMSLSLITAVLCTVAPAYLLGYGIARIGTGPSAVVSSVGPVSTLVLAALLLGERVGWAQVLGLALVIGGGLKLGWGRRPVSAGSRAAVSPKAAEPTPGGELYTGPSPSSRRRSRI
jgi:drug/metabolite transporter (DMT)-like permease